MTPASSLLAQTRIAFACTTKKGKVTAVQPLFDLIVASADESDFNDAVSRGIITGKPDEVSILSTRADDALLVIGVGDRTALTPQALRMAAGTACGWLRAHPRIANNVAIYLYGVHPFEHCARLIMEGWVLRNQSVQRSVKLAANDANLTALPIFLSIDPEGTQQGSNLGETTALMAQWVRVLGNLRGSEGTPEVLATRAYDFLADLPGVTRTLLDQDFYEGKHARNSRRFGAFLSVADGAKRRPYGILAEHYCGKKGARKLMIIGKGVTYDTGGFNRKPGIAMNEMYMDMMGMANATALFKLLVMLVGQYCDIILMNNCTENYDGTLPSDIILTRGGELIEINNTDAEGRLVVGDGADYGVETFHPDVILDLATLTAAAVAALGGRTALFSSRGNSELDGLEHLLPLVRAVAPSGFNIWPMPMPWSQAELMGHAECDGVNTDLTATYGCGTAGLYLAQRVANANRRYKGRTLLIHADIAGAARRVTKPRGWQVPGASPDAFISLGWGLPGLIETERLFRK